MLRLIRQDVLEVAILVWTAGIQTAWGAGNLPSMALDARIFASVTTFEFNRSILLIRKS